MLFSEETKKEFLIRQNKNRRIVSSVQEKLNALDENAKILSLEEAIVSRDIIKKLWDILPDENCAFRYESIKEMIQDGAIFLPDDKKINVTFHLGWDILSFSTTLEAAWKGILKIAETNIETFNSCIYPNSFEWYFIRAGKNFYPMDCLSNDQPQIMKA